VNSGPSTYDYLNLSIAIVAAFLALTALAWQAWAWLLSGPRVTAEMKWGLLGAGGGLVSGPPRADWRSVDLATQGFTDPVVAVEIRNKGRTPTTVTGAAVRYSNGIQLTGTAPPAGDVLPHRLEAHSTFTYLIDGGHVGQGIRATVRTGGTRRIHVIVTLATGKTVQTNAADFV